MLRCLQQVARRTVPLSCQPRARAASASAMSDAGTKRKNVKIGTHSGTFHCDEALGCFLLRRTEAFKDAQVVRSREPDVLNGCDIVIDVGGVYDPSAHRYDHHQRDFSHVFGHGFETKLSSAGLVYKHFGKELIAKELGLPEEDPTVLTVYLKVYKSFMQAVDAIDNGIHQWDVGGAPPRYETSTDLSSRVSKLNPKWNEEETPDSYDRGFEKAMALTGEEFMDCVDYYARSWLPARQYVQQALQERHAVHPSGLIMQLPRYCPWKDHLFDLEASEKVSPLPLFMLYQDQGGAWRVQAIPINPSSFENRRGLLEPWRGVRDDALSALSGIPGCIFVHAAGFIGGNKTRDGALAMAVASLPA